MSSLPLPHVSVRSDFVKRAAILQDDPLFAEACEQERQLWNRDFPEYAIRDEGIALTHITHQGHEYLYPPHLEGHRNVTEWLTGPLPRSGPERATAYESRISGRAARELQGSLAAKDSWKRRILRLCERFFPACDYPSWMPVDQHPAHHFVAGCIINGPRYTDPQWILNTGLGIREIPIDPNDPSSLDRLPKLVYWRERCLFLEKAFERRIRERGYVEEKDFRRLLHDAEDCGNRERQVAESQHHSHKVLPLHLGLTARDLRSNAQPIASEMDNDNNRRKRALLLHQQGYSNAEIAKMIGRTPKMVKHYIKGE